MTPVVIVQGITRDAVYRARGTTVEFSANGGQTFVRVHTTSQSIDGGAVAKDGTVWLFARGGLVVRSTTTSGWIESNLPAGTTITGIQPVAALEATVTAADGAVFGTTNGGTTWVRRK